MIPIHCLTPNGASPPLANAPESAADAAAPSNGICYLLAKSGIYKQVCNPFYTARVKVAGIGHLGDTKENVEFRVPKLPLALLRQAEALFERRKEQNARCLIKGR